MGIYTDEQQIEGLTQIDITSSTNPTTAETVVFIEQVESRMVDRALGAHTASDQYLDVPPYGKTGHNYDWEYTVRTGRLSFDLGEGCIIPLIGVKSPIINIASLAKNDESADAAPSWDTLTEWDGSSSSTSFMLLRSGSRDIGHALWFYDNFPLQGPKRLKVTYVYGHNVNEDVLAEYATYGVAIKVLEARMNTNEPDGMLSFDGGDLGTYIPRHYERTIRMYETRMAEIEKKHFPNRRDPVLEVL